MTSVGSVTSRGVGSGFELQQMLDDFREVDEAPIELMREDMTEIETEITILDEVTAKLIAMKSHALSLSLESNFIERSVTASDEDVATATALRGAAVSSTSIDVVRLATKSSWQTAGVASADTIAYIPTAQESTTGLANADQAAAVNEDGTMTISYGESTIINIDLTARMSLDDVAEAVNSATDNDDSQIVLFCNSVGKDCLRFSGSADLS